MKRELDRQYLTAPNRSAAGLAAERSLAVLIVADEDDDALMACLDSIASHLPELPVFVHGVEHAELTARHPNVHWTPETAKLGFAEAFNALAARAPSDADLVLLDVRARVLGPLTRTRDLLRLPRVAAVSPLVRDDAEFGWAPWDVATRRRTPVRELAAAQRWARRGSPIGLRYAVRPTESRAVEGDLADTCLAINRAAWNAIGGFDEEYVGFGAAADWQTRARAAGWRLLLADELGAERSPFDDSAEGAAERRRHQDMVRANTALLLEHQNSVHHADAFLAGTAVVDRLRRSKRDSRAGVAVGGRRRNLPAVVITTNRLVYGGAERQKALLATELDRRGYSVTVVCVQRFGPLITEIPHSVRVVRQPWWAPIVDIPEGPAVLITADTNTEAGFATLWRAGAPGRRWLVAPHVPPEEDRPIYSRPLTAAMRRSDGFIVLAERHWEMLAAQHRLWGRRFVAPNGVAAIGEPAPRVRDAGDPLHLVMLSRIVEHKNPHLLIDALGDLVERPWKLSIFGDGPDRERLQARTPSALRDRVHWRGWSAGPGPALADADLLCVPSRSEAFPLVILEAMARAVPVAASAICAVPEMLDFGAAGYLVDPASVSGWRRSLAAILANPEALPAVGRRGFERMRKLYTVEAMADAYVDAIQAVL